MYAIRSYYGIFDTNWDNYNAGKVVYQPKHMSPERLMELYHFAWETFYKDAPQTQKMFNLLQKVTEKEMLAGTYTPRRRDLRHQSFGKQ